MKRKTGLIAAVIGALLITGTVMDLQPETQTKHFYGFKAQDMAVPLPKSNTPTPTPTPRVIEKVSDSVDEIEVTYTDIEYEYLGRYFITAYCPSECGYNGNNYPTGWMTANGTVCHRADYKNRLTDPTTCAIDRRYHSFGDMFYIEEFDRVFVAEDTGSAVKKKHIDLYFASYQDMAKYGSHYETIYRVEFPFGIPQEG